MVPNVHGEFVPTEVVSAYEIATVKKSIDITLLHHSLSNQVSQEALDFCEKIPGAYLNNKGQRDGPLVLRANFPLTTERLYHVVHAWSNWATLGLK